MFFVNSLRLALKYSIDGLRAMFKERAFRQEILLGFCLVALELFRTTPLHIRFYLFSSFALILTIECLNSAIETVIDRISLEAHHLSKRAKDIGSAAVLIALLHFGIVWLWSWLC